MIYNSFKFIIFFPFLFLLYYAIPCKYTKGRNLLLLILSYLLYFQWKPAFFLVLLWVTSVTYCGARILEVRAEQEDLKYKNKRLVLIFALLGLFPLLVFKYFNFLNESISTGLAILGLQFTLPGLNWAIPIGISFFTFQAVGYMMDVYFERIKAEKNFWDYALFVSFFPSIMSGPINKASLVLPQIKEIRPYFDYIKAVDGLKMLLWGMFMKVVVADRVGLYADTVLPNYLNYTGVTCFVASIMYTIQIYADFAGYSFMAIGVGKTLGFELTENFRRPYFAYSITDLWHRWHISLSTWLKDYVYIPLGGSRCSKPKSYWNIFVTFLVSGIWHGANWTFIIWGCVHGVIQIIEKILGLQKKRNTNKFVSVIRILITFLIVNFAWIFFRMPTLSSACGVIRRIFDYSLPHSLYLSSHTDAALCAIGIAILFAKDFRDEFYPDKLLLFNNSSKIIRWLSYITILIIILLMGVFGADQFIYANF